jgi:hypothetical protein
MAMPCTGHAPTGRTADGRRLRRIECDTLTVSRYRAGVHPTHAQRRAARRLIDRTVHTLRGFRTPAVAEQRGYRRVDTHHWIDPTALADGRVLDPRRPESLVFDVDPALPEPLVVGAMYLAPPGRHGPQVGGPLTTWHFHVFARAVCAEGGAFPVGEPDPSGACAVGSATTRSAEMLHVWVANRRGHFDSRMTSPTGGDVARIRRELAR